MRFFLPSLLTVTAACSSSPDRAPPPKLFDPYATDASVDSARPDVSAPITSELLRGVDVEGDSLAYDSVRGVLYTAAAGSAKTYQNKLVAIDPAKAAITGSIDIGSDPTSLAISDDSSTLWVGLKGALAIRRVDLTTTPPTAGAQFTIPKTPDSVMDSRWAGPMAVLQGTTDSVAISTHRSGVSPSYSGTLVMDNGVARANQLRGHTGCSRLTRGPAGLLFGYNNLHTGFGFYTITVSESGLSGQDGTSDEKSDLIGGFNNDIVYGEGRVFAYGGEVIDVATNPSAPTRLGKFAHTGAVLPIAPDRVLMVSPTTFDDKTAALRILDSKTFTVVNETALDITVDHVWGLIPAGNGRYAFLGEERFDSPKRVYIITNPFR